MSRSDINACTRVKLGVLLGFLAVALAWALLVRVPLVVNAASHLDSDLAVDGLTLLDATKGHWRWHYPGTPHSGIPAVLLSWPQAWIAGANPITLVSGGAAAYGLLLIATFALAWRAFGRTVAAWSLVPLAFGSTGLIWLSGRITGGHLLIAAWQSAALFWLHGAVSRRDRRSFGLLGLWCGLGLYLDQMFVLTLAGIVPSVSIALFRARFTERTVALVLALAIGFVAGDLPREIGNRANPYDAYPRQFQLTSAMTSINEHAYIFIFQCLPRLVGGHRLADFQPLPGLHEVQGVSLLTTVPRPNAMDVLTTLVGLAGLAIGLASLWLTRAWVRDDQPRFAVRMALLLSSIATIIGFILNRNIFGSDNYRYLVPLIAPWCIGLGIAVAHLFRAGGSARWAGAALAIALGLTASVDAYRWNLRLGWIEQNGRVVRRTMNDPALAWLEQHPETSWVLGGYWDVYRLSFLSGGRVRGLPTSYYPDRFPELRRAVAQDTHGILLVRPDGASMLLTRQALASRKRALLRTGRLTIYEWP